MKKEIMDTLETFATLFGAFGLFVAFQGIFYCVLWVGARVLRFMDLL